MAINYYAFVNGNDYIFANTTTRADIYAYVFHGSLYGTTSRRFQYYRRSYNLDFTNDIYIQLTTSSASTAIIGGRGGSNAAMIFGVDAGSAIDTLLTPNATRIEKSSISGRRRFKSIITQLLTYTLPTYLRDGVQKSISCPVNYTLGGVEYDGLMFNFETSGRSYADRIILIRGDNYDGYTLNEFISTHGNSVIDFGDGEQEIPTLMYNWLVAQSDAVYPYTYTVKSADGTVLASMTDKPPMRKAELSTVGERVYLTLTGSNDVEYSMDWTHVTPPQKIFNGLGYSPNDRYTSIPTGAETDVVWNESKDLYELYGRYVPPLTTFSMDLMKNSAEKNRVDKSDYLTLVSTISGALRQECSIVKPSVTIQASSLPTFNYVHIPIFNRYYFVIGITSVIKDLWRIDMDCDVLMTYRNAIAGLSAVIGRQENSYNAALVDTQAIMSNKRIVSVTHYPNTWLLDTSVAPANTTKQILLNVIGSEYGG